MSIVCARLRDARTGAVLALSASQAQQVLAAACAERIARWLGDAQAGFYRADGTFARLRPFDIAILVRQRAEAAAMRQQLHARGIASVYLSDRESVFASAQAQDMLYWLRAAAAPLDVPAVRAALATRLIGLPLPLLAHLAADEQAFEPYLLQLQQLHGIWQRHGVLAMLRQTLYRFALPARWLQGTSGQGERCLTNYLHLAELLQNAASQLDGEQALIRWLAAQIATPGAGAGMADEQIVRLESDADRVQIVTIHKSKGLEYPLVCLPFVASYRPVTRRNSAAISLPPDMASGLCDGAHTLLLDYSDAQLAQAERERLREDVRLLYVALTRARHALWLGLAPLRHGKSSACINEKTAIGHLLAGSTARSAQQWLDAITRFCQDSPGTELHLLDMVPDSGPAVPCTVLPPDAPAAPLRPAAPYQGEFDRHWGIASYSSLVRGAAASVPVAAAVLARAAQNDEGDVPIQHNAHDKSAPVAGAGAPIWHRFARGPLVGNLLHEQLHWLAQENFALPAPAQGDDATQHPLAARLLRRAEQAGHGAQQARDGLHWLATIVHHRLPPLDATLAGIAAADAPIISEMEFWLPVEQLAAQQVDALCRQHILPGQARAPLAQRQLHGMLMGFADLVFCHAGRYWVLDYKTSHLGPDAAAYGADALVQAMCTHRYDVQAAIYLLALHRLLRQRLGAAYRPQQHLGGALTWFVRGLDGAAGGVHWVAPEAALLDALDALLQQTRDWAHAG